MAIRRQHGLFGDHTQESFTCLELYAAAFTNDFDVVDNELGYTKRIDGAAKDCEVFFVDHRNTTN